MTGLDREQVLAGLPPAGAEDFRPRIRELAARGKLVVLDDDPTGTQTVRDVPVLTTWGGPELEAEFAAPGPCFFILTNSRSMAGPQARALNLEIAANLKRAARGRRFTLVSRGDSTLRGHFPAETDALAEVAGPYRATVLMPYFEAGGRLTISDVHYVQEGARLVPCSETPFAADKDFGYRSSNLREYVEEKTGGRVRADGVRSVGLEELRGSRPEEIAAVLGRLREGSVVVVNACNPRDAERFALATLLAEEAGVPLLHRTAAQFVAARLGQAAHHPWTPAGPMRRGLVLAGSHVPKTGAQLERLFELAGTERIELSVAGVLGGGAHEEIEQACGQAVRALAQERPAVVYTSRTVVGGHGGLGSLEIAAKVSSALVEVARRVAPHADHVIAKGGITSSDIATKALGVRRAIVLGQLAPGVPVWQLGPETLTPGRTYVVFPGNVGNENTLAEAVRLLRG